MVDTFRRVVPGFYRAANGELHIDIPELLAHHAIADTQANRNMLTRAAIDVCRQAWPTSAVTVIASVRNRES
jgi:hypothetical protein